MNIHRQEIPFDKKYLSTRNTFRQEIPEIKEIQFDKRNTIRQNRYQSILRDSYMLGWILKISIISILLIMIFHYSSFCFKQDIFSKQTVSNDDLKVQKYKNIISALSQKKEEPIEDMSLDLLDYVNQRTTSLVEEPQIQLEITEI